MSSTVNASLNNRSQSLNHNQDHIGQNMAHLGSNLAQPIGNSTNLSPNAKGANHNPPVSLVSAEKVTASPVTVNKTPEKDGEANKIQENQSNGSQEPVSEKKSENNGDSSQQSASPVKPVTGDEKPVNANTPNSKAVDVAKPHNDSADKANIATQPEKLAEPIKKDSPGKESNKTQPEILEKPKEAPSEPVVSENKETKKVSDSPAKSTNSETPKSVPAVENKPADVAKAEEVKKVETAIVDKKPEEKPSEKANAVEAVKSKSAPEVKDEPTEKKPDAKVDSPAKKEVEKSPVKAEEIPAKPAENSSEISPNKDQPSTPVAKKTEVKQKSTLKLATVTPNMSRKRKKDVVNMPLVGGDGATPKRTARKEKLPDPDIQNEDSSSIDPLSTPDGRSSKRNRTKVQPYQVPTPELAMLTKFTVSQERTTPTKQAEDKLIVFYKNEFLAVRNPEGSFYVCQTTQNVYRSTRKIKIRWLSQDKTSDPNGEIYKPDFYDTTDIECVLTTLSLQRASSGWKLGAAELARTQSILGRALAAERGEPTPETSVTEEHPDGLDLSLYKDESQLEKKKLHATPSRKRRHSKSKSDEESSPAKSFKTDSEDEAEEADDDDDKKEDSSSRKLVPKTSRRSIAPVLTPAKKTPAKKSGKAAKSPKGKKKSKTPGKVTPVQKEVASSSKTATPTTPKAAAPSPAKSAKKTPTKSTPAKNATPSTSKGKTHKATPSKASAAAKAAQLASTPSTSTGKATRTPRKPPGKK